MLGEQCQAGRHPKTETASQKPVAYGRPIISHKEKTPQTPTSAGESHQFPPQIRQESSGPNSPNIVTGDHGTVNIKQE